MKKYFYFRIRILFLIFFIMLFNMKLLEAAIARIRRRTFHAAILNQEILKQIIKDQNEIGKRIKEDNESLTKILGNLKGQN